MCLFNFAEDYVTSTVLGKERGSRPPVSVTTTSVTFPVMGLVDPLADPWQP